MAEAVKNIGIILRWYEVNAKVVGDAKTRIAEIANTFAQAKQKVLEFGGAMGAQTQVIGELCKMEEEETSAEMQKAIPSMGKLAEARQRIVKATAAQIKKEEGWVEWCEKERKIIEKMEGQEREKQKTGKKGLTQLTNLGMRMGWLGYRMTMMGRILMGYVVGPIKAGIEALRNWQGSIELTAYALGMLAATNQLTKETSDFLTESIDILAEKGPEFEAAWLGLEAILTTISARLMVDMAPAITAVTEEIRKLWPEIEDALKPALDKLAQETIPALIEKFPSLVKALGGVADALPSTVEGFTNLVLSLPDWFLKDIGYLLGVLIGLSPLLLILGTGLYFASTAAGVYTIASALLTKGLIPLIFWIGAKIAAIGGLILAQGPAVFAEYAWATATTAAGAAMTASLPAIATFVIGLLALAAAVITIAAVIFMLTGHWGDFVNGVNSIISSLTGAKNATDDLTKSQEELGETTKTLWGESIGEDIAASLGEATAAYKELQITAAKADLGLRVPVVTPAPGGMGVGGTEQMTVYTTVNIGTVTGVADLDMVYHEVNRAVADAARRRGVR